MKSKKAFTMIELIFVIVIIGILASIALPHLSITRDDAKITKTVSNLRTLLYDAYSFYVSQSEEVWKTAKWSDVTDTLNEIQSSTNVLNSTVKIIGDSTDCFSVQSITDINGTLLNVISINTTDIICKKSQKLAQKMGILDDVYKREIILGGQNVTF